MYPLAPFIVILKKEILEMIKSYEDVPFWGPKWSICPKQNIFVKNYYFVYLLAHFIVENYLKILTVDPEFQDEPFLRPKWPICSN